MNENRPTLGDRLSYRIDNLMSGNPAFKLFALFGLTSVLVLLGGTVYWVATAGEEGSDFIHGLWAAWTFIADAGTQGGEQSTLTRAIALVITVGGMMIFALLLGLVSETLGERVDELKKGRSRVIESDHSLILGWNEKIFTLVQQLIEANASRRRAVVVILSDRPKEEMEEALRDAIADFKSTTVVCRSGDTTMASDLRKVNAQGARSIVVLGDDHDPEESDIRATKTVLALRRGVGPLAGHLVVELMESASRPMVEMVGHGAVEVVSARDLIGRLMVQTSRQNGLAHAYARLLCFEGSEFYLKEWKEAHGRYFGEVWGYFPETVVCGVMPNPNGPNAPKEGPPVILNPPDDYVIGPGDQLLFLAEDDDAYGLKPLPPNFRPVQRPPPFSVPEPATERLLFLGWRADMGTMIRELDGYVVPGSQLTLVSTLTREEAQERLKQEGLAGLKRLRLTYQQGNLASRSDLEQLKVEEFHSILVLADETSDRTPDEVDARTLMSLLLIRDIQRKNGVVGIPVLSEIRDPRTKDLAAIAEASDYVVSNEITSMLMAQVSEKREMNAVWGDLFDSDGNEIYLKHVGRYVSPGEPASFFDVMARARARREVAIGYRSHAQRDQEPDHGVVINPPDKTAPIAWSPEDRVIVLSESEA